ncbi:hypothetical protein JOD52_002551 [Brachybacterium muris]|uniref:hypothetical protein n=1 Tax=Brachybacterium muris TaxID=219301 RepID=UPI00195E66D5|nr:hypothetical protein [Brachybacterium muris]
MSDDGTAGEKRRPRSGPVVISSLTGRPMDWDGQTADDPAARPSGSRTPRAPILPDRMDEDRPEPGADESNDARIASDVPPHWGRGR